MIIESANRLLLKISGEMLSGAQDFGLDPSALEKYAKKINKNIAIGVSRKSLIGELSKKDIEERLEGSLFVALWSILNGARLIRVHDVKETLSFMKSWGIDC